MSTLHSTESSRYENGEGSIERLSSEDMQNAGRSVISRAGERASQLKEGARDLVRRSSDTVLDKASALREGAQQMGERTSAYVRDEPTRSILAAAALGATIAVAVMLVMNNRRSSSRRRFY